MRLSSWNFLRLVDKIRTTFSIYLKTLRTPSLSRRKVIKYTFHNPTFIIETFLYTLYRIYKQGNCIYIIHCLTQEKLEQRKRSVTLDGCRKVLAQDCEFSSCFNM